MTTVGRGEEREKDVHGEAFESQSFAAFTLDFLFCVLCLTVFFTEDLLCFLFNYN